MQAFLESSRRTKLTFIIPIKSYLWGHSLFVQDFRKWTSYLRGDLLVYSTYQLAGVNGVDLPRVVCIASRTTHTIAQEKNSSDSKQLYIPVTRSNNGKFLLGGYEKEVETQIFGRFYDEGLLLYIGTTLLLNFGSIVRGVLYLKLPLSPNNEHVQQVCCCFICFNQSFSIDPLKFVQLILSQ